MTYAGFRLPDFKRAGFAVVLTALLAIPGGTAAIAQEIAAWRVECSGDGKTLDCRALQQLFQRDTRQLLVALLARKAPDPKAALLTLQLPLGLSLTEPVQIRVDNAAPERQPIQTCTNTGCFVSMTAGERLVSAMRTGNEVKLTIQDINKKPIELSLPLLGFGLAFDKVR